MNTVLLKPFRNAHKSRANVEFRQSLFIMSSKEIAAREQITYFLKASLASQYYLLISPFRVNLIQDGTIEGSKLPQLIFKQQSWLPQKCLCLIFTCLSCPWMLYCLRGSVPTNPKNPAAYLAMGFDILVVLFQLSLFGKYWLYQAEIIKILNFFLCTTRHIPLPTPQNFIMKARARVAMVLVCVLHVGLAILYWFRKSPLTFFLEEEKLSGWKWLWASRVLLGRDAFFVGKGSASKKAIADWVLSRSDMYPFTGMDAVAAIVGSASQFFSELVNTQCDLQLLVVAGTLWVTAKQFGTEVARYCSNSRVGHNCAMNVMFLKEKMTWEEVRQKYNTIRELSALINQVFGWNFGFYFACYTMFNSISIDGIFKTKTAPDLWLLSGSFVYIFLLSTMFYICVDICSQVPTLKINAPCPTISHGGICICIYIYINYVNTDGKV